jgi:hypothetical protein
MNERQRQEDAVRKKLSADLRAARAIKGLNAAALHADRSRLFKAIAHALCYRAQFAGMSAAELSDLLHERKAQSTASLSMSDKLKARLLGELGLKRVTEYERKQINKLLHVIYHATNDVETDVALGIFARFLKVNSAQVGIPVDVVLTRLENLDALQRFAGGPKRYIPEDQYGL